jgi:serine phosphatase RsbU (regulator of sigma subunit)/anti-sigma regulatory factor (Ser/Thr protein kinase)
MQDQSRHQPDQRRRPATEDPHRRIADLEARIEGQERERMRLLRELHRATVRLDRAQSAIGRELEIARGVQAGLLPRELPHVVNMETAAVYMPTDTVGGDLYDIFLTPTQKVAILIFDVSGHGVPAALIAAAAKMLFAHYIEKLESPAVVFNAVNKQLCRFIQTDHYLTAFLGILDPIRNTMVYSRAGHVRPIIYRAGGGEAAFLEGRGFFIGHAALLDIAEYSEETIALSPDDKVLFYTDGLTEGCDEQNRFYGSARLLDAVRRFGARPPEDFLDCILQEQTAFRNGVSLRDDFTMLCIKAQNSEWLLRESGFRAEDGPSVLLASAYADIDRVCSTLLRAMDHCGFSDVDIKRTKVCVFEMLVNAIEHGNRREPAKRVIILYAISPEKAMISVVDEGEGFDYGHLPNPLSPENILKDHGRGLFIINQYMDAVSFNEAGNRILAIKYPGGRR